ncbi:poly-gamma-glutamate synthesis protein (capsule biosynthesis protein) [Paenibacillus tianmuensis]|uniref:Poly-gamma-glutamate synthesis protein (Capsule biosynthesis protein) n=1 Tax=Paenibacillus tianmuensis TaxID=624147 RepID=A0A1G4P3Z2_9BACL|nr:CapA family protein [Paenibacillus tianmuensis]SCW26980.1 poly-gamma-glutamate synthesis protein (capsule biosynthesis protein) [Paenibacillus tianmuensis]
MSREIIIAAVGDLLMKPLLIRLMRTGDKPRDSVGNKGGLYKFEQAFESVARYLQDAHLTIGNLETTFAGGPEDGYMKTKRNPKTGNPSFNCPDAFASALKASGFNVLATANNHCMDYGIRGLRRTLEVLDKNGIAHVGTFRNRQESRSLFVQNVEGVRIGIVSYTRDTNGIPIPKNQPAGVKKLVRASMKKDLKRLRAISDFIVVCMHCGYEYHQSPSAHQKELVRFLFRQGADVVLGSHPHVLQPAVCRTVKDVDGRTRDRFAIYSLGNFISTRLHSKDAALSGLIVRIRIRKASRGSVRLAGVEYVPTWVCIARNGKQKKCRIVPLRKAIAQPEPFFAGQLDRMKRAYRSTLRMYNPKE